MGEIMCNEWLSALGFLFLILASAAFCMYQLYLGYMISDLKRDVKWLDENKKGKRS